MWPGSFFLSISKPGINFTNRIGRHTGTGAGGAVTADILARAGLRVVMIEEGEYRQARDFTLEERHAYSRLYYEGGARKTEDHGITILQGRS